MIMDMDKAAKADFAAEVFIDLSSGIGDLSIRLAGMTSTANADFAFGCGLYVESLQIVKAP
jgi:hypothetical protein